MKANIEVTDRKEAELIRKGLDDAPTRALVKVMGALADLPTLQSQKRVLDFVGSYFDENK